MSALPLFDETIETPEGELVDALGQKGALLRRALALGCPVPMGFHVPASWAESAREGLSAEARHALWGALDALEARTGLAFDGAQPLCVAVRSSPRVSQPGALPTVLDVGATATALAGLELRLGSRLAALDCRVRFLRAITRVIGVGPTPSTGARRGVRGATLQPTVEVLEAEITELEKALAERGATTARDEVELAVVALARASKGALVVQAMAFGNSTHPCSGAGVATSRQPITGEALVFGEIAWARQGEDLSQGRGSGVSIRAAGAGRRAEESLEARAPRVFESLAGVLSSLERALDAVVEAEIVLEGGVLSIVQVRPTVLTPRAEIRAAVDWANEGRIERSEAVRRVRVESMAKVGRIELLAEEELTAAGHVVLGRGLGASPGAGTGMVAIEVEDALARAGRGERVVLVRSDASPEDAPAVRAAMAVATASGGLTSHAAVMSRALGRPCAVSVSNLRVRRGYVEVDLPGRTLRLVPGDLVSVDGTRGLLVSGAAPTRWVSDDQAPRELAEWARDLSSRLVVVDDGGLADPIGRATSLAADGVWDGRTVINLSGQPRADLGIPQTWVDPTAPLPTSTAVVVPPQLVAAARVAATRA